MCEKRTGREDRPLMFQFHSFFRNDDTSQISRGTSFCVPLPVSMKNRVVTGLLHG